MQTFLTLPLSPSERYRNRRINRFSYQFLLNASPWEATIQSPPPMSLAPGTQFGPYAIVSQLGSGGMGVVYEAKDPHLKRTVAIKLLPPDLTKDETAKQRFLQEA